MKKKLISFLLIALLVCSFSAPAFAAVYSGDITFTADGKLAEQNFNVDQIFSGLQPGDDATYTVNIHNRNSKTTRWYMSNEVLKSLEASAAAGAIAGGAYTYRLTYSGPGGSSQTLFDSTHVGGDNGYNGRVGLREATGDLENFFFLDTLNSGENGVVTLYVALEGETQGNTYQEINDAVPESMPLPAPTISVEKLWHNYLDSRADADVVILKRLLVCRPAGGQAVREKKA